MKTNGRFVLFAKEEFISWLKMQRITRTIKLIQNHHTYIPDYKSFTGNNHFALLNAMRDYHVNNNGWQDIAQNLTTFPDGTIAVCRPLNTIPAGIKGANQYGLCIEHVGNFDARKDVMSDEHRDIIISTNAAICSKFNIVPSIDTMVYHSWYNLKTGARDNLDGKVDKSHKSCPGDVFFGGNSSKAAETNFIPLIKQAMEG